MPNTFQQNARTWYLFFDTLKTLRKERKKIANEVSSNFKVASINASILIHVAAILEGAVNSLLSSAISSNPIYKNAKRLQQFEVIRLFEYQFDLLQKAAWDKLSSDYSKTILGYKLQEVYNENWAAIKHLFAFRNILAHGGLILKKLEKSANPESLIQTPEDYITKRELFEYLHEKGLIKSFKGFGVLDWQFINTEIVEFFELHTKEFLICLYHRYSKEFEFNIFNETDMQMINELGQDV